MPLIRAFIVQQAGDGSVPWVLAAGGTFFTLNTEASTGLQTVHLPNANTIRGDVCAVRVINPSPPHTVRVQSPPGTTVDTFAVNQQGTRVYIFDGQVYRPFGSTS